MKTLTVSALVCAMMALTGAAESHLVKRTIQINGRWFRFVPQAMTWAEAEKNCQSLGGNLASIHNMWEYQQIQELTGVETWVGGSDAEEVYQWFWSDGTHFDYNKWCPGEPNNGGGRQHCLQINYSAGKCWDDVECYDKKPSVCVIKA